jgi:CHAT domain
MKILILASNPRNDLDLDDEIRDLKEVIDSSRNHQDFEVEDAIAIHAGDLQNLLFKHEPQIVHFCGHGGGQPGLVFEGKDGGEQWVRTEALRDLFRLFSSKVGCVLLNACYSEEQANEIVNHIDYVIGMNQAIRDDAAIAFAKGFYRALGNDCSIDEAYEFGCNAIQLEITGDSTNRSGATDAVRKAELVNAAVSAIVPKIPEHLKPVLKKKQKRTLFSYDMQSSPSPPQPSQAPLPPPNKNQLSLPLPRPQIGIPKPLNGQKLLRYPSLDCPDHSIVNQYFTLTIELLINMPNPGATVISVEDTDISKLPEVEVVLRVHNFNINDINGSNRKVMKIEREDDSAVTFDLTPFQLGEQQIRVDFYQYGRRIGTARRNILVSEKPLSQKVQQPEAALVLELKSAMSVRPPDLELCVELDRHDNQTLYYELHSVKPKLDYHHTKVGQVTLQTSPLEKMQAVYRELSKLAAFNPRSATVLSSTTQRISEQTTQEVLERAERRLTSVGNQLWDELVSDELKQQYWQFKGNVKSLLITSDEPWVPWEMIKPYRHVNGKEEQDLFWCQQFSMSRWLSGPSTADDLAANVVLSVAPSQSNLSSAQEEMIFLTELNNFRSSLSSVSAFDCGLDLEDYIRDNEFSILHFACHGMFDNTSPNDSAILLNDGPLRPSDLRLYFNQTQPRPLIFINACHGGRIGFSFTGLGGWAEHLVKARVGAFVGAMWEVNDVLALQFAKTFYKALLQDNRTIAEAFCESREVIRQMAPYNSTWLAYSLYADPEARIQEEVQKDVKSRKASKSTFRRLIEWFQRLIRLVYRRLLPRRHFINRRNRGQKR